MYRRTSPKRRAVVAAELAFILPVLMLLVLICIDFGRFAYAYIGVHNAARAGAAHAIMNPVVTTNTTAYNTWKNKIQETARDEMTNQTGYDPNNLTVDVPLPITNPATGERRITVTANYASFETLVSWPGIPDTVTLTESITMRAIR